jgi:hypothetical protein
MTKTAHSDKSKSLTNSTNQQDTALLLINQCTVLFLGGQDQTQCKVLEPI